MTCRWGLMERYENLGLVGQGSYGAVMKWRHRDNGRIVAVKKFLESDEDKTVKKMALREIRLLKQLRHENLVNLLEVWKRKRRWYLVFEFVEQTLLDELEQFPNGLEPSRARKLLYQILRAIAFCHQHGIIHRDVKPENVLVSQHGVVKLCDFGFARATAVPGEVYTDYVATRWYRAPELLVGDTKYDKSVDVWAVGCLFVEMLTGVPLFPGDSDIDQLYHIIRCFGSLTERHQELFYRNPLFSGVGLPEPTEREPLHTRFPHLSGTTADLIQKCLQMEPEKRAPCSQLLQHDFFTKDGFHLRFTIDSASKTPKEQKTLRVCRRSERECVRRPGSDEVTLREKHESLPEDSSMVLKDAAPHDWTDTHTLRVTVEGGATQERRVGAMYEGRGGVTSEVKRDLTHSGSSKHTLEDLHRPNETITASRPPELPPKTCPAPGPGAPHLIHTTGPGAPPLIHAPLSVVSSGAALGPLLTSINLRSIEKPKKHVSVCYKFSQQSLSTYVSGAPVVQQVASERSHHCRRTAAGNAGKVRGDVLRFPELRTTLLTEHRAEGKPNKKDTKIPSITTGDLLPDRNT